MFGFDLLWMWLFGLLACVAGSFWFCVTALFICLGDFVLELYLVVYSRCFKVITLGTVMFKCLDLLLLLYGFLFDR